MLKQETPNTFKQTSEPKGAFSAIDEKVPEVEKSKLKKWITLFLLFDLAVAFFLFSCVLAVRLALL